MATTPILHRTAVSAFFFFCGCTFASWAARIPSIKDQFHFNEAELGAVLFMLPLGALVALPIAGWAVSAFGSRLMTFLSAITYAVLLLLLGYCSNVTMLSTVLFFFGFWGNFFNISVNTQALQVQDEYAQKPLMSSFHGMWSLGAMTGAFVGGIMMKLEWTTRQHFWMVSIITSMLAICFLFLLVKKDKPRSSGQKLFAWPTKALWLLGAICFCCALCEGAMADWSSLYYKQVINDLERVSTTGYTAFAFMMAFGRLIGDGLTARLGYKGILLLDSLIIASGLGLAIAIQHPVAVIAGFGLVGFGVATIIPIVYTLAGKTSTMAPSVALAAVSSVGFTGFLVGPPAIGFIAHEISLRWAFLIVLMLGLLIGVMAKRVRS